MILIDGASEDDWIRAVQEFPARLAKIDRTVEDGLTTAMFALWRLMRGAPDTVIALFARLSEGEILSDAEQVTDLLAKPAFGFEPGPVLDAAAGVRAIAGHLRAIDLLSGDLHNGGIEPDPANTYAVKFDGATGFVIPVERRLWRAARTPAENARLKGPFDQRATVKHRILPGVIDGAKVVPYRGHWPSGATSKIAFGAALFPKLEFLCDEDETSFLVTGIDCDGHQDVVSKALANCHSAGCVAAVFPELTIDDATLARIDQELADKPWMDEPGHEIGRTPAIVLAGSWHRRQGSRVFNLAPVRTGDGVPVLEHRKRKPYQDKDGRFERIETGRELPVLVFDHCLIAFGICLDFCDQRYHLAYDEMDVDLVLVPSCGHDATMESHIENARLLLRRRKSRTMVVQQIYSIDASVTGYILPPEEKYGRTPNELASTESWSIFETQFTHSH